MDAATLALAKAYADSQRLAYMETAKSNLIFDGDATGKFTVPGTLVGMGEDTFFAKVTDSVIDANDITKIKAYLPPLGEAMYFERTLLTITDIYGAKVVSAGDVVLAVIVTEQASNVLGPEAGTYLLTNSEAQGDVYTSEVNMCRVTIHPIDPKYIPAMDSVTLNSPGGKKFAVTVSDTGALTATEVTP